MIRALLTFVGLIALIGSACTSREAPRSSEWTLQITAVPTPADVASTEPQLTASEHGVILSWIENEASTSTLKFAERTSTGWSAPRSIVARDDLFTNFADVPSVVRLADRTLVAHWMQQSGPHPESYDLQLSRSADEGRTWSPAFSPHHDGTQSEHGFASLVEIRGAGLGLVWLDGRAMKPPASHDAESTGNMSLRATSFDREWKQSVEVTLLARVCECCPTAGAVTSDGAIVAFRNRSADETRDIYVLRSVGGMWSEPPVPVHNDGWKIDGCPVNGPAISANGHDVSVAWFTVQGEDGRAFVAFSQDAGKTFAAPIRVDDGGSLGRVDVEQLEDGSAVVAWIEFANRKATFNVRRVERSGHRSPAVTVADLGANRNSGYPRIARQGHELVFAWTGAGDGLRIQTAVARLP